MDPKFAGKPINAPYSARTDIDQMPETPNRGAHHRRAQSETFFRFPDDILLDDVGADDFNLSTLELPSLSSDTDNNIPMTVDSCKSDSSNGADNPKPKPAVGPINHFRSLSVDADFFDGLGFGSSAADGGEFGAKPAAEKRVGHHRHSNSMDGFTSSFEDESMLRLMEGAKKATAPDRLAELALIDPKRAKRILANRQSAARSKERKIRYTSELERKVQTLQTEATTLSAQVTLLQRDTTGLTAENKELKLRLQAMEQQAHLRDALNETLREEVQRLKIATGEIPSVNGNPFSRGLRPQFSSNRQAYHHFGTNQTQQPQQQQHHQMSQSTTNNQTQSGQPQPSFLDFN